MDPDGSTTPASPTDPAAAATPPEPGTADLAVATTPTDASVTEQERQRRDLQSQRDRLHAENERLKAQIAAAPTAPKTPEPAEPTSQPGLKAEDVLALLKRDREMTSAVSTLREEFPFADDEIFNGYEAFDSVEAFRAEAERSHARITSLAEKAAQPLIDAALAPYIEKYGRLAATPPSPEGGNANGLPSLQEVKSYTPSQLEALVAQHGEDVIERLWRSATTA